MSNPPFVPPIATAAQKQKIFFIGKALATARGLEDVVPARVQRKYKDVEVLRNNLGKALARNFACVSTPKQNPSDKEIDDDSLYPAFALAVFIVAKCPSNETRERWAVLLILEFLLYSAASFPTVEEWDAFNYVLDAVIKSFDSNDRTTNETPSPKHVRFIESSFSFISLSIHDIVADGCHRQHNPDFFTALDNAGVNVLMSSRALVTFNQRWLSPTGNRFANLPLSPFGPDTPLTAKQRVGLIVGPSGDGKTIAGLLRFANWNRAANAAKSSCIYLRINDDLSEAASVTETSKRNATSALIFVRGLFSTIIAAVSMEENTAWTTHKTLFSNSRRLLNRYASDQIDGVRFFLDDNLHDVAMFVGRFMKPPNQNQDGRILNIVVDEAGIAIEFVRGILAGWDEIQEWLGLHFHMRIQDIRLTLVGTGSKHVAAQPDVSAVSNVYTVDNRSLFFHFIDVFTSDVQNNETQQQKCEFFSELQAGLYETISPEEAAILQQQDLERARTAIFRFGVNFVKLRRDVDIYYHRFGQLVTFSAQGAIIAFNKLMNRGDLGARCAEKYILKTVFDDTFKAFGFNGWQHAAAIETAVAKVMMNKQRLSDQDWQQLVLIYGVLRDTQRGPNHCPHQRFIMSETITAAFCANYDRDDRFSANANIIQTTTGVDNNTLFELAVANHHAVVFDICVAKWQKPRRPTPPLIDWLWNDNVANSSAYYNLDDEDSTFPFARIAHNGAWTGLRSLAGPTGRSYKILVDHLKQNKAVVIVNGARASFADVIILSPGVLYLVQCKHLTSKSTKADCAEEFWKMHGAWENSRGTKVFKGAPGKTSTKRKKIAEKSATIRQWLINICKAGQGSETTHANVLVKCSIVISKKSKVDENKRVAKNATSIRNDVENFTFVENIFDLDCDETGHVVSALFPVLTGPLEYIK